MHGNRSKSDATAQLLELGMRPRLLDCALAAAYLGLSAPAFLKAVADGHYPQPLGHGTRRQWDVRALDAALDRRSGLTPFPGGDDEIMRTINAV